ncbi:MAG: alanine--tRNA ligase [Patescibacteria group bacterium]
MKSSDLRQKYLNFFATRGHAVIPSASLIPENDPTVLFTTAGMHPLVPFLLGEQHPAGKRLTNIQKCVRTGDIDDVGDTRHLTFFEMLGNWSLGDYFREDCLPWTFEFLTSKEEGLGLDPQRLFATVFEGDADAPRDEASIKVLEGIFRARGVEPVLGERIFAYPKSENWWGPAGQSGPCGPDSEIFYDVLNDEDLTRHSEGWQGSGPCQPSCSCGRYVEIGNNVLMQYFKHADGHFEPLAQKNVDFGGGFERLAMILQGVGSVFETDLFRPVIEELERQTNRHYGENSDDDRLMRIIADHMRTAVFMLGDERGITPSNLDQGYVLRRLIRRSYRYGRQLGMEAPFLGQLAVGLLQFYGEMHPDILAKRNFIIAELEAEEKKFGAALEKGEAEALKLRDKYAAVEVIPGAEAFYLYESFGFPREMTEEVLGKPVDVPAFEERFRAHQELSRSGAEQKFSGGLADHSEEVVKLHTATHLLHAALRQVLGAHVEQKGSNITADRLRFDFTHGEKMTDDQKAEVEKIVNEAIEADYPVHFEMMTVAEAKDAGAIGLFEEKYATLGDKVKCYFVGTPENYFSTEICGGPHVEHTGQLGHFTLKKEESSSAGVRRIKAVLN